MIESKFIKKDIPEFKTGDTIKVILRIDDDGKSQKSKSKKERTQTFEGIVMARKGYKKQGVLIYRTAFGSRMERFIMLHSPNVLSVSVTRFAKVRRAKMYELRKLTGQKPRIKESIQRRERYRVKKS